MFSHISPEQQVRLDHPLRRVRTTMDPVLQAMSPHFAKLYSRYVRPSIPSDQSLRALQLRLLCTVHSERQLMEQLNYNLLYHWFVELNMEDQEWDVTVFKRKRDYNTDKREQNFWWEIRVRITPQPGLHHPMADRLAHYNLPHRVSFVPVSQFAHN